MIKWTDTEATEKEREHREKFMLWRPARRPQSGISLWSLFISVLSVSLICSFIGLRLTVHGRIRDPYSAFFLAMRLTPVT